MAVAALRLEGVGSFGHSSLCCVLQESGRDCDVQSALLWSAHVHRVHARPRDLCVRSYVIFYWSHTCSVTGVFEVSATVLKRSNKQPFPLVLQHGSTPDGPASKTRYIRIGSTKKHGGTEDRDDTCCGCLGGPEPARGVSELDSPDKAHVIPSLWTSPRRLDTGWDRAAATIGKETKHRLCCTAARHPSEAKLVFADLFAMQSGEAANPAELRTVQHCP